MAGKLRKLPGRPPELGMYAASGTLQGLVPGRRVVRSLEVRHLDGASREGLEPLKGFADLETLEMERLDGVDLAPLAELSVALARLQLLHLRDVDLAPLGRMNGVARLALINVGDDCPIPTELSLPATVWDFACVSDSRGVTGTPVRRIVEAVDWERLSGLRYLSLRVGGNESIEPIEVDLSFLRHLPNLERLDITQGVWHVAAEPSPLQPPFTGLSRQLTWSRLDAWGDTTLLREQLTEYLGGCSVVLVSARYGFNPEEAGWTITPDGPGETWQTYGSLSDLFDWGDDRTEYQALAAARKRLRAADPELLARLEFDPESSGTGIAAPSRDDLARTLELLGVTRA